jgi:hypothetical protein
MANPGGRENQGELENPATGDPRVAVNTKKVKNRRCPASIHKVFLIRIINPAVECCSRESDLSSCQA